ncbi:MAG: DUF456 domain-containing protein [Bacteroidales bacterium]|nr:DUF456 domain-containing protein [Bacteroidales bacterium]MDD5975004.1 DUF456 domain-containing protein [Bacteroidales bacterium]MDY5193523.1 DUF456 domain-containing protein [Candidatus Aphodosoma sp.]
MEIFLFIAAGICIILSIIGSIIPGIPGPPLGLLGVILLHITDKVQLSITTLIVCIVLTVLVTILDFVLPIVSTKKIGGSKSAVRGSIIGMVIGLLFTPIGVILGTLLGAIIGELLNGSDIFNSLKIGVVTFCGTILGTGIKVMLCCSFLCIYVYQLIV